MTSQPKNVSLSEHLDLYSTLTSHFSLRCYDVLYITLHLASHSQPGLRFYPRCKGKKEADLPGWQWGTKLTHAHKSWEGWGRGAWGGFGWWGGKRDMDMGWGLDGGG